MAKGKGIHGESQKALMAILADVDTPADVQVKILAQMLDTKGGSTFFETMFRDLSSFGACPCCGHENHWAIPEQELNLMGFVSAERDPRVHRETNKNICASYEQACPKKKISV